MTSPAAETNKHNAAIAAGRVPHRRGERLLALALIILGGVLLAANLGLLRPDVERLVQVVWPASLIAAGLWLVLARQSPAPVEPPTCSIERGDFEAGELLGLTGTADLHLRSFSGTSHLLIADIPGLDSPRLEARDGVALLKLQPHLSLAPPRGAGWSVELVKGLPWRLNFQSSLGDFNLDLHDLTVAEARLRSMFGDVDLILPTAGESQLAIDLLFGDLTLRLPEGVGARIKLAAGPLVNVRHDDRRFIKLAPNEWATPLYAVAAQRCTLAVGLGTGDLYLK
jgi:hypothetical protein